MAQSLWNRQAFALAEVARHLDKLGRLNPSTMKAITMLSANCGVTKAQLEEVLDFSLPTPQ